MTTDVDDDDDDDDTHRVGDDAETAARAKDGDVDRVGDGFATRGWRRRCDEDDDDDADDEHIE